MRAFSKFCGPNAENPAVTSRGPNAGSGGAIPEERSKAMKFRFRRKPGGFSLRVIVWRLSFGLDYPSSAGA